MDTGLKLMLFGPTQGNLVKALFAPARPRRGAARPGAAAPELDAGWPAPDADDDPALSAAALTTLLGAAFTNLGH